MKALIVTAGKGTRMGVGEETNKSLLLIGDKSILMHSLDALAQHDIHKVCVVVGHCGDKVTEAVGDRAVCINNPEYAAKGIVVSIACAREQLYGEEFIFLTGDVFYESRILEHCRSTQADIAVLYEKKDSYAEEDSKLSIAGNKIVRMGKHLSAEETSGEFGHMIKFSKEGSKILFDEIDRFISRGDTKTYLMDVINAIIERGILVTPLDIGDLPKIDIDFPEELERARVHMFPLIYKKEP